MRKKNGIYIENVNFKEEELDFTGTVFFCLFVFKATSVLHMSAWDLCS